MNSSNTVEFDPYVVNLAVPIPVGNELIEAISLRDLRASDLRSLAVSAPGPGDLLDIAAVLSGQSTSTIDQLSSEDADDLLDKVAFLVEPTSDVMQGDPAKLRLRQPVRFGKNTIEELELDKPTARHRRLLTADIKCGQLLEIGQALTHQNRRVVDLLSKDDAWDLIHRVVFLLGNGRRTMK